MSAIPGRGLIALISYLVPEPHRSEWRAEWVGELSAHGQDSGPVRALLLRLRCFGAISDALWFRRRYREPLMMSHNLKYALRLMRRRPGFSSVVILTLALGIGGTTAIYSVVNAVLLRQLPYFEPDRLVMVWGEPTDGDVNKVGPWTSYPDYQDLKQSVRGFSHFSAYRTPTTTLTMADAEPRFVQTGVATADFLPALGVEPVLGRSFSGEEEKTGMGQVAVLTDGMWRTRLGADPGVLGRVIHLDGTAHTVIGVLPPDFGFAGAELWVPLAPGPRDQFRGTHTLSVLARLGSDVEPATAEREVREISSRLEQLYPEENSKRSARLEPLFEATVNQSRQFLLALMGGVVLVLLIVCCNVANLFLTRAASRGREIAVRTAVGAGRARLFHQFLTESLTLTILGALAGFPIAWFGVKALVAAVPQGLARADEISMDFTALGFMLIVAIVTGLVFGIVPSLYLLPHSPGRSIRERGLGVGHQRASRAFVVSQLALAAVLVIGAGLLAKNLWRLNQVDLRFDPERLVLTPILLPPGRYDSPEKVLAFYRDLHQRLSGLPGIRTVSLAFEHPLSEGWTSSFTIEGGPAVREGEEPESRVRPVAPGYFGNIGLAILAGRDISDRATLNAPGEVVINQAFVDRHFSGQNPIGRRLRRAPWWPGQPEFWEIVGVVANERFLGLNAEADPATYYPHAQFPMNDMVVMVRAAGDPAGLESLIRREVWNTDRDLALEIIVPMETVIANRTAIPRFNLTLIGLFAGVALLLAAIGVYGVLAHMVTQRTPEIGIRLALGAERGSVLLMVVSQGFRLSLIGAGLGVLIALGATRILTSQLSDVRARDPIIFGSVALALILVAITAAYLPARRASRVDPLTAIRND
jgi:putative ABC transport system permease protein